MLPALVPALATPWSGWIRPLAALAVPTGSPAFPGGRGGGTRSPSAGAPTLSLIYVVRAALARLPERQRRVLELRHLVGLEVPDVATALAVREPVVRWRLSRGLSALRRDCRRRGLDADVATLVRAIRALSPEPASPDAVARCASVATSGPLAAAAPRARPSRLLASLRRLVRWPGRRTAARQPTADPP